MGPVQWHVGITDTKMLLQLSSKLRLTSQTAHSSSQRKYIYIYIENDTTYNQIHF